MTSDEITLSEFKSTLAKIKDDSGKTNYRCWFWAIKCSEKQANKYAGVFEDSWAYNYYLGYNWGYFVGYAEFVCVRSVRSVHRLFDNAKGMHFWPCRSMTTRECRGLMRRLDLIFQVEKTASKRKHETPETSRELRSAIRTRVRVCPKDKLKMIYDLIMEFEDEESDEE